MSRLIKVIVAVLAAGALAFAGGSSLASQPEQSLVSGTIRWVDSSTWVVLDDAAHEPVGIESVVLYPSYVRVVYDFTAAEVGSCQVTPDEAFASANVRVGTSVGLNYLNIFFYMPSYGSSPVPPSLLSKATANVWITCLHREASDV